MTYKQWIDYLAEVPFFGEKDELKKITRLMHLLGDPQDQLKIIHVAGTNGKGSVCAMASQILIEEGYKVGTFTSPHLTHYNERLRIQMNPIEDEAFAKIGEKVLRAVDKMKIEGIPAPSFFEIMTACAFLYFFQEKVDFVLLEVGLGGRLDPTNIIKKPLVSVITPIDLDHTSILGSTIEEIAGEKSGIIKKDSEVVLFSVNESVYNVVNAHVQKQNGTLYSVDTSMSIHIKESTIEGTTFSIQSDYFAYNDLKIRLLGDYQLRNAGLTLLIVEALRRQHVKITESAVQLGLQNANWPGRMEVIKDEGYTFIFDGAHNSNGMKNYLQFLSVIGHHPQHLIIGFNKDKDYESMLQMIKDETQGNIRSLIFTPLKSHRTLEAKDLTSSQKENMILAKDAVHALQIAKSLAKEQDYICCGGSLYLVGELREQVLSRKEVDL